MIAAPRATGIDNNNPYLAQDFAAAESLDVVLRENGAAPPAQTLRVAGQLAEALDYAADRQIVHGALHPRDILLSQEDIRIVGLGVARALERVGVTAPVRRPYAAPERINDGGWDRSADVFSLAAIAFEMLSGKRVTGTGSEAAEALEEVPGGDTEALQRVFALALAADPAYRYSTATAFTDALKDAIGIEIAAQRPRAKRKPRLRVVSPEPAPEPELPGLSEAEAPLNEAAEVEAVQEVQLEEQAAVAEEPPLVKKARRRRAPAPTPVAIETIATPEPEAEVIPEPEPVLVAEMPVEFAPVEEPAPEPIPDPQLFAQPEPPLAIEPEPILEPEPYFEPEPELEREPDPEPQALNLEPVNAEPMPAVVVPEPREASVWPIGVAALLGIALGFAVGYMVAIRDRVIAPPVAATPVSQPAGKEFTEVTALPAPPPTAVAPTPVPDQSIPPEQSARPVAKPDSRARVIPPPKSKSPKLSSKKTTAAPASAGLVGTLIVESRPQGAAVIIDGRRAGTTPLTVSAVRAGRHAIRIEREGYRIWTAGANVSAGEKNRVTASLEK